MFHLVNRGNNKRRLFFKEENYHYFIRKMEKHLKPTCEILAYCLMPNHFHIMIFIKPDQDHKKVSKAIQIILRSFARGINRQEGSVSSLFQQKTGSTPLLDSTKSINYYPKNCFNYIHKNPVKGNLAEKFEDWPFSSFGEYLGINPIGLVNKKLCADFLDLPRNKKEFYRFSGEGDYNDYGENLDWGE